MTTTAHTSGPELERRLLQDVGNESVIAAVKLLGGHRDGFWLREFLDPASSAHAAVNAVDVLEGGQPWIDWHIVDELLENRKLKQSSSELAVLAVAASIAGPHRVNLARVLRAVDEDELSLVVTALTEA